MLLLSGGDVNLLRIESPPLSVARLKAALPNLVEEYLLCDPSDCVIVAGGYSNGSRTIGVAQRDWISLIAKTFITLGARHVSALPSQSCLAYIPDVVTATISEHDSYVDLTLRLNELDGFGISIKAESSQTAPQEVIQALSAVVPKGSIKIYVTQGEIHKYREYLADKHGLNERVMISAGNWSDWIPGTKSTIPDLMTGNSMNTRSAFDWHAWRWPLVLGSAVLLINISALNIDWWHMKSDRDALRSAMTQIFKSTFPNESVIIDPLAQMQQKISIGKRNSGMSVADDFPAIAASFGEAWASVKASLASPPSITGLEYHDRGLLVRLKPDADPPTQQMKAALTERGLALESIPSQTDVIWQIRSVK